MSVQPAGHWPGVRVTLLVPGMRLPCAGRAGAGLRDPPLAAGGGQAVPGGEAPAPSSAHALSLSPCAGGLVGLSGMWLGEEQCCTPMPPAACRLSLPGWVSVGIVACVQVSAAPWLPHSCPAAGRLALQAGRRQVPGSGGAAAPFPHLPAGTAQPPLPLRETKG